MRLSSFLISVFLLASAVACTPAEPEPVIEATSLDNKPLERIVPTGEAAQTALSNLEDAETDWKADSTSEENIIWYGRRLAYMGRYQDAIDIFSNGLLHHPDSYKLRRHRGHRYISTRQLDLAIADLETAAELTKDLPDAVEPDGLPNARNQPTSTDQTNIWYHLGLAYFLKGQFTQSTKAFEECLRRSHNNDMRVATLDWLYMGNRRLGRKDRADRLLNEIEPGMDIIENTSYYKRLLMYKGMVDADSLLNAAVQEPNSLDLLTQGFGVGHWYLVNGDRGKASRIFQLITMQSNWAAFGYIAAEAELHRMR